MWNWQSQNWLNFQYDTQALESLEKQFLLGAGESLGALKHIDLEQQDQRHHLLMSGRTDLDQLVHNIDKSKLFSRLEGRLNPRQEKCLLRMFREGADGFKGGMSAMNYMKITGASSTTSTRDLQDLVEKGALLKIGKLRYTRYYLNISASQYH